MPIVPSGNGAVIFGNDYQTAVDITTRNNTANNTFSTAQTFTTSVLPAGTYRIEVKYFWAYDTGAGQPEFRVQVDGASLTNDIRNSWETSQGDLTQRVEDDFVDYVVLTNATHIINFQYRSTTAHDCVVYWSRLTAWRVA